MRFIYRLFGVVGLSLGLVLGAVYLLAAPVSVSGVSMQPAARLAQVSSVITQPVTAASPITVGVPMTMGDTDVALIFAPGASGVVTATLVPTTPVNPLPGAVPRSWFITTTAENYEVTATFEYSLVMPVDVVIAFDQSGSMEFDTLCYGCWTPSNEVEYPDGNRWPLPWNGPADGPPAHCAGSTPYQYSGDYFIAIEAEEYSYLSNDYHRVAKPGDGYTYWVMQRNGQVSGSATGYLGDAGAWGRDARGAYLAHFPYRTGFNLTYGTSGVPCSWDDVNNGRICRRGTWIEERGGPFPAPRADYAFTVPVSGEWYFWIRAQGGDHAEDPHDGRAIFWGLTSGDGVYSDTLLGLSNGNPSSAYLYHATSSGYNGADSSDWIWGRLGTGESNAAPYNYALEIGVTYTLHLWAGSSGFAVDRIILTDYAGTSLPSAARGAGVPLDSNRTGWACDLCDARFGGYPGGSGGSEAPNCDNASLPEAERYRYLDDLYDDEQWLASAAAATVRFIRQLDITTQQVGLVKYDSTADPAIGLLCLEALGAGCTEDVIANTIVGDLFDRNSTYAHGSTNIADALEESIGLLNTYPPSHGRPGAASLIILMSDGPPNKYARLSSANQNCYLEDLWPGDSEAHDCAMFMALQARDQGIMIHTISMGRGADMDLMQAIADVTGGMHFQAPLQSALDDIMDTLHRQLALMPPGAVYVRETPISPWRMHPLSQTEISRYAITAKNITTLSEWTLGTMPISMTAQPPALTANGTATTTITATVVRRNWSGIWPVDNVALTFTTSLGAISPITTVTAGGAATAVLTAGMKAGQVLVSATASDRIGTVIVDLMPPAPQQLELLAEPTTLYADGHSTARLMAIVTDVLGNPANSTPVIFSTTLGTLSPSVLTVVDGIAALTLTSGLDVGLAEITAIAGIVSNTVTVDLAPREPYSVVITATPTVLPSGLPNTAVITVTVYDVNNYPISNGTLVTFSTSLGTLVSGGGTIMLPPRGLPVQNGILTMTLLLSDADVGIAAVTATAGSVSATVKVACVPLSPHAIALQSHPAMLLADGQSIAVITATVTDEYGYPVRAGTMVTFATSRGGILPPQGQVTSDGVVTTLLTSSLDVGIATVTATAEDVTGSVQVPFVPLNVHTITVRAMPSTLPADGQSTAMVTATVSDAYGHAVVDGTPVLFETSLGVLLPSLSTTVGGKVTTTLVSTLDLGIATVTARVGDISSSAEVTFVPSTPYTITMQARPTFLPADGNSTTVITAAITDVYGHPVAPGTVVTFATSMGTLSSSGGTVRLPPRTLLTSDGVVTTLLTSSLDVGIATVTATAEGVTGSVQVLFVPLDVHTVTVQVKPSTLPADGRSTAPVTATVSDTYRHAVEDGTPVLFETSLGALESSLGTTEDGKVTTTLVSALNLGVAVVTARVGDVSNSAEVTFVPLEPYTITMRARPTFLPADGNSTTVITAAITDVYGHPVAPGTLVTFATSMGTLSSSGGTVRLPTHGQITSDGVVTTLLTSSFDVGVATLTATSEGVTGFVQVSFVPLDVHTVTVQVKPSTLPADGQSIALVTATVSDVYGRAIVDGTPVLFETSLGTLEPSLGTTEGGEVTTTLVSALDVGVATVTARVGDVASSAEVTFASLEPYTITLVTHPTLLPANDRATAIVMAMVLDAFNQAVQDGTPVTFTATLGMVSPLTRSTMVGVVTTTFTAGAEPGRARIEALAGRIQAFVELDLRAKIYLPLILRR